MSQAPILITGGGQRLGRYCAERLHDDGHPVIITYRRERPAIEALRKRGITALYADFSSESSILEFIARLKAHTHALRAIIHNASHWQRDEDSTACGEDFALMFQVHMQAPYLINLHAHTLLMACPEPMRDIIHITDYSAAHGSQRHMAYAATKAGLENLTLSMAGRFAPDIKVNAIAPAGIMLNAGDSDDYLAHLNSKSALPAVPGPMVIWQGVRYLLDSAFVTGITLPVDGGRHVK
ncbi:dihydromonapterin reductase [Kushneria marisflavi]|uniref:Dihydromonapterin reductase n=1 Tax=Kushneria marisflavi TaxID=157779 RepID=A0A240UQM2_9GAMM|nr:dihydromonapterin reductase [Kushneria marisflavi]ART63784.1 dihydromonapterin reductase [Kushneria marisflavi]RKD85475.1 dihydromonapterin reductase/dihydrofolate reductase [Kushneria marisflavi]